MSLKMTRRQYAEMFGPTVGDRVRLADTELFIEVERDYIAEAGAYGDEVKFGGGKVIRDGMGQSPTACEAESLDLVITNALILDGRAHCGDRACGESGDSAGHQHDHRRGDGSHRGRRVHRDGGRD